jgi:hypothetical protein
VVDLADTAPEVRRRQLEAYRAMGPQRRVEHALALSEEIRRVAIDGMKQRDPSLNDEQIRAAWLRMLHGPDLAEEILAHRPPQ